MYPFNYLQIRIYKLFLKLKIKNPSVALLIAVPTPSFALTHWRAQRTVLHFLSTPDLVVMLCDTGLHVEIHPTQTLTTPWSVCQATRQDGEVPLGPLECRDLPKALGPLQVTSPICSSAISSQFGQRPSISYHKLQSRELDSSPISLSLLVLQSTHCAWRCEALS